MAVRYQSSGAGPKLAVVALFVVLAGLVYVFWGTIQERLAEHIEPEVERGPETTRRAPPKPASEPVERKPAPKKVVRKPVERRTRVSDANLDRARELRVRADTAYSSMDFDTAASLYGKEARALARDQSASSKATERKKRAETFDKLLSSVERNPETSDKNVVLRCHDGRDMEVVILGETGTHYIVGRKGNIRGEVKKSEVREIKRVPKESRQAQALSAFRREEAKLTDDSGISRYLLGERAYRDGLDEKALEYLEKAYARNGVKLPGALEKHQASQMLVRAMWCESTGRQSLAKMWCQRLVRTYTGRQPQLVADAKELIGRMSATRLAGYEETVKIKYTKVKSSPATTSTSSASSEPEEKVTGVEVQKVASRSVRNKDLMAQINNYFEQGMDFYVKGRPGMPNSNKNLSKAVQMFDKVIALCDKALQNDPGNSQIESRQADASRYGYHARKMKTLGIGG